MTEETNSSPEDILYPMNDAAQGAFQMALDATKWVGKYKYKQSDAVMAAAMKLAEEHPLAQITAEDREAAEGEKLSASDVDTVCKALEEECKRFVIPDAEISKLIDKVRAAAAKKGASLASLQALAHELLNDNSNDASSDRAQFGQNATQQLHALREEIQKLEKDIATEMEAAHARGDVSDEDYERWKKLNAQIEGMAEGKEKNAAIRERAALEGRTLGDAADKAEGEGRTDNANTSRTAADKSTTIIEKTREADALLAYGQDPGAKKVEETSTKPVTIPDGETVSPTRIAMLPNASATKAGVRTV